MGGAWLLSCMDTIVLMVPFVAILAMSVFHLDERIAAPKQPRRKRRFFCGIDAGDRLFLYDPDGKPWPRNRIPLIEARFSRAAVPDSHESTN